MSNKPNFDIDAAPHALHDGKAIYNLLGINIDGQKELLGLHLSDQEGARH